MQLSSYWRIMKRLLVVTGELSALNYAKEIVRSLRDKLEIYTVSLAEIEGAKRVLDANLITAFGIFEAARKLPSIYRGFRQVKAFLKEEKPDAVLLIDFPGFNLKVAKAAKELGIKVIYFISPKFWAWGEKRGRLISKVVDRMYVIFPFEVELYRKFGLNAIYVGNPVVDRVKPLLTRDEFLRKFGISGERLTIALLPGSRFSEIKYVLPPMLQASKILGNRFQFILPVAKSLPFNVVKREVMSVNPEVKVVPGDYVYDVMFYSDVGIVTSGTATLESAVAGLPHVAVYKLNRFTYYIAKKLVKVNHIALPNIVAGKEVVRELIQDEVTPEIISDEVRRLIETRERLSEKLRSEVAIKLKPKAIERLCSFLNKDLLLD